MLNAYGQFSAPKALLKLNFVTLNDWVTKFATKNKKKTNKEIIYFYSAVFHVFQGPDVAKHLSGHCKEEIDEERKEGWD